MRLKHTKLSTCYQCDVAGATSKMITDAKITLSLQLHVDSSLFIKYRSTFYACLRFFCISSRIFFNDVTNLGAASVHGRGKGAETSASEVVNTNAYAVSPALEYFTAFFSISCTLFETHFLIYFQGRTRRKV